MMPAHEDAERRQRRERVVHEHAQSENVQQWDRTMATFSRARYELPDGTVVAGEAAVRRYWLEGRAVVPDQRNEIIELTHFDGGPVQIEFWLRGTPTTTHEPFEIRLWAIFDFDDGDLMTNERVYADRPTPDQIAGRVTTAGHPI